MDQHNFQQKLDHHVKNDMMQVLSTSSPTKLQDAREDNNFKKLANKLNGVLIKMESHAIALRDTLNTYEQKSAAFCRMGGVRPPTMNAFSRMDAMLTDFIQAIPSSSAPPAIIDFSIQVGAPLSAPPAIEQPSPAPPQRVPTLFLSRTPSTSQACPVPSKDSPAPSLILPSISSGVSSVSLLKDKKKKDKKKKTKKRELSSDSGTDVEFY